MYLWAGMCISVNHSQNTSLYVFCFFYAYLNHQLVTHACCNFNNSFFLVYVCHLLRVLVCLKCADHIQISYWLIWWEIIPFIKYSSISTVLDLFVLFSTEEKYLFMCYATKFRCLWSKTYWLSACLFVCLFPWSFPFAGKKKKSHNEVARGKQTRLQSNVTELFLSSRAGADPQDVLPSRVLLSKPGQKAASSTCMALASCTWKYITNLFLRHP